MVVRFTSAEWSALSGFVKRSGVPFVWCVCEDGAVSFRCVLDGDGVQLGRVGFVWRLTLGHKIGGADECYLLMPGQWLGVRSGGSLDFIRGVISFDSGVSMPVVSHLSDFDSPHVGGEICGYDFPDAFASLVALADKGRVTGRDFVECVHVYRSGMIASDTYGLLWVNPYTDQPPEYAGALHFSRARLIVDSVVIRGSKKLPRCGYTASALSSPDNERYWLHVHSGAVSIWARLVPGLRDIAPSMNSIMGRAKRTGVAVNFDVGVLTAFLKSTASMVKRPKGMADHVIKLTGAAVYGVRLSLISLADGAEVATMSGDMPDGAASIYVHHSHLSAVLSGLGGWCSVSIPVEQNPILFEGNGVSGLLMPYDMDRHLVKKQARADRAATGAW